MFLSDLFWIGRQTLFYTIKKPFISILQRRKTSNILRGTTLVHLVGFAKQHALIYRYRSNCQYLPQITVRFRRRLLKNVQRAASRRVQAIFIPVFHQPTVLCIIQRPYYSFSSHFRFVIIISFFLFSRNGDFAQITSSIFRPKIAFSYKSS